MSEESKLLDLIGEYFDLGYAEGVVGRDTDTMAGDAQRVLSEIQDAITASNTLIEEQAARIAELEAEVQRLDQSAREARGAAYAWENRYEASQARLSEAVKVMEEVTASLAQCREWMGPSNTGNRADFVLSKARQFIATLGEDK